MCAADLSGELFAVGEAVVDGPVHLLGGAAVHPEVAAGGVEQRGPGVGFGQLAAADQPSEGAGGLEQGVMAGAGPGGGDGVGFAVDDRLDVGAGPARGQLQRRPGLGRQRRSERLGEPAGQLGDRPAPAEQVAAGGSASASAASIASTSRPVRAPANRSGGLSPRPESRSMTTRPDFPTATPMFFGALPAHQRWIWRRSLVARCSRFRMAGVFPAGTRGKTLHPRAVARK
jgi:hypothetical protein